MIKYIKLIAFALVILVTACSQEDLMIFNGENLLLFGGADSSDYLLDFEDSFTDTVRTYSFVYFPQETTQDTVFFNVYVSGNKSAKDRYFELEQVEMEGVENAVEGVHFLPFNSAERKDLQIVKAGEVKGRCGVVLLRDESLQSKDVVLRFQLKENSDFGLTDPAYTWRKLVISDQLVQSNAWDDSVSKMFLGRYSKVKHRFMIEVSGLLWDDECFEEVTKNYYILLEYWKSRFKKELALYNQAHPGDLLTDEFGDLVQFEF